MSSLPQSTMGSLGQSLLWPETPWQRPHGENSFSSTRNSQYDYCYCCCCCYYYCYYYYYYYYYYYFYCAILSSSSGSCVQLSCLSYFPQLRDTALSSIRELFQGWPTAVYFQRCQEFLTFHDRIWRSLRLSQVRVRTDPGNPGKPWKPMEKPRNFFIKPWKISQNFIEKKNRELVDFVDFITSKNRDCRILYHFKTSFCVRNHCLVLK